MTKCTVCGKFFQVKEEWQEIPREFEIEYIDGVPFLKYDYFCSRECKEEFDEDIFFEEQEMELELEGEADEDEKEPDDE